MREQKDRCPIQHRLAISLYHRKELLVVEGDDGQGQRDHHENNRYSPEQEDIVEQSEEQVGVVKCHAGEGQQA